MLKQVLFACLCGLAAQAMEIKPLYHHPVYGMPVYAYHPYAPAVHKVHSKAHHHHHTAYAAMAEAQTKKPVPAPANYKFPKATSTYVKKYHHHQKMKVNSEAADVTNYAKPSTSSADVGARFFWDICHVPHRRMAALFTAFDTDYNGVVSFAELSFAAECEVLSADEEGKCHFVHDIMGPEIEARSEYAGQDQYVKNVVVSYVLSLFNMCDENNDNMLNMDEFYDFGHGLYDTYLFAVRSTRDSSNFGTKEEAFDLISQDEWDCVQNEDEDGLEYPQCNPSVANGQILLADLEGNNGDDELNLWEFMWVKRHFIDAAKASDHYDDYCGLGYTPGEIPDDDAYIDESKIKK